jgi:hypothetical protein
MVGTHLEANGVRLEALLVRLEAFLMALPGAKALARAETHTAKASTTKALFMVDIIFSFVVCGRIS